MKTIAICLTVVFVTLKILGILPWSWFWCLCPFIFYIVFWLLLFVIINAMEISEQAKRIKENEERSSKWQKRIDEIREQTEALKKQYPNTDNK